MTIWQKIDKLEDELDQLKALLPKNDTQNVAEYLHEALCSREHDFTIHSCDWFNNPYYPDNYNMGAEEVEAGESRTKYYELAQKTLTRYKYLEILPFLKILTGE